MVGLAGDEILVLEAAAQQASGGIREVNQVFEIPNQNDFGPSVVEADVQIGLGPEAADTGRAAHEPVEHVRLHCLAVADHAHMDGLDVVQRTHTGQQIRKPSERTLVSLRRLIRHVGEQPKGRHIGEPAVCPKRTDVDGKFPPLDDGFRGLDGIERQAQRKGHIIDRSAGDITQRRADLLRQLHQTGDGLVECAVAAGADDQIELRTARDDLMRQVFRACGRVNGHVIAAGRENSQHVHQAAADGGVTGVRVDKKQHFFLHNYLNM